MTKRRPLDQYFTPGWATQVLLHYVPISGYVIECCSGQNDIADALRIPAHVITNDIDPAMPSDLHLDATVANPFWARLGQVDWVVSNPPFNVCQAIVEHAYDHATVGVAMLLRLSYLEPCKNRGQWLAMHPPSSIIACPRISFTGDGKTDNVATAWFIWLKSPQLSIAPFTIVTREEAAKVC